jgi:YD repeat-containing protein
MKKLSVLFAREIFIESFMPLEFLKKRMYRSLRMIICFVFLQTLVTKNHGQQSFNYIPQTPIATQYEKYINYPVNHSTGSASIVVPLYAIKAGSIEVPVNLSYHTSGVKPSDPCLPIGIGWTINPGARISRKILGYPDEIIPKPPVVKLAEEISPTADIQYLENLEYEASQNPSSGYTDQYDPDYDIFTYQTGTGVSGKFVIKKQGAEYVAIPIIATKDKIKIGAGFVYLEITDANGVCYRFGDPLTSYSAGGALVELGNYVGTSGWMLTDIISADKADTISFKWTNVRNDAGNFYKQRGINDWGVITDSYTIHGLGSGVASEGDHGYSYTPQRFSQLTESYSLNVVIAGIRYKNQEVKFTYVGGDQGATKLNGMEVYSNGVKFRQVDFHKSLFANSSYLKLDSVSIQDKSAQTVNRYRFGYNETWSFPLWPHRKLDFWGYYNGQDNQSLMPNFSYYVVPGSSQDYYYSFSTASRAAFSDYAQTYILNRVTYPTGGKTTYEYESNMFKGDGGGSPTPAGGLRVKKISHWASDGQLAETRSYQYGTDGGGDGSKMDPMWYVKTSWTCWHYSWGGQVSYYPMFRKRIIGSEPNETIFIYDYPSVTYRTVTEYIGDANGNNSGKIVYNYSQAELLPVHSFQYSQEFYGYWGKYWDNPRLLKTTYYKNSQGTYVPVRYTSTIYNTPSTDTIKSIILRRYAYFDVGGLSYYEQNFNQYWMTLPTVFQYGTVYFNYGGPAPGITRNVEFTASGDSIVTIQNYDYANNDYRYVKSVATQNSNGVTTTTHYTYPKDYDVGTSPTNSVAQGIKLLKDRNVVAPVIEEYTEVQPGNKIKSGRFTTYKTDKPLPENMYVLGTGAASNFSPATITSSVHNKSSLYDLKNTFDLYDPYGNVRQFVDQNEGINTVLLYSYGGQHTIAVIRNATYASVASVLGGDAAINSFASSYPTDAQVNNFVSSLRSSLPQAQITTYTYQPLVGMTSQTDIVGRTTTYHYDAFGRLSYVKDKDGNVVKRICYNYQGQPGDCSLSGNTAKSQGFTKQGCPPGTEGTVVYYTVPQNKYYGSSQAEADALAQAEIDANGQAYADANGSCVSSTTNVYCYNSYWSTAYTVYFYNTTTEALYSTVVYPGNSTSITIPNGTYNVSFYVYYGNYDYNYFSANGYSTYGYEPGITNVPFNGYGYVQIGY